MKIQTFNSKDIVLVTDMTDYQQDFVENQFTCMYHNDGLYIPGDCLNDLLDTYEPNVIIHN